MPRSLEQWGQDAESNPVRTVFRVVLLLIALSVVIGGIGWGLGWFSGAAKVAQQEFGPEAMLEKYEWFKDASAALDAKVANIAVYENRFAKMQKDYGADHSKWPRDAREQESIWQSEVAGVIASYNNLAADYNAQMAKFNWRFANKGELPKGADTPLPREYKPYKTN